MSLSDASVLCALAQSQGVLVGARFAQGGGALTSAAACEPAFAEVA